MTNSLTCPKCQSAMDWTFPDDLSSVLPPVGESAEIARCPKCDHIVSIENEPFILKMPGQLYDVLTEIKGESDDDN